MTPTEQKIEEISNLIGRLEMMLTDSQCDIYTKIASISLNIGDMRISLDKLKESLKEKS